MSEDSDDSIAAWAANLTPEGAPGEMSSMMRRMLGDQGYERAIAENEILTDLHIERQRMINKIMQLILVGGGVVGATASLALVASAFRNFSRITSPRP